MGKSFYSAGLHFQCQGSGKCCVSRGEYGYVYLTKADQRQMAKHLNLSNIVFKKKYVMETDGVSHLVQPKNTEDCVFLSEKKCSVYEARPTQCRTWPFWPENMNSKSWKKDVIQFCPGAQVKTKKSLRDPQEIKRQLDEQAASEKEIFGG